VELACHGADDSGRADKSFAGRIRSLLPGAELRSRYRARPAQGRHQRPGFRSWSLWRILRALGIASLGMAYLFHALFGWGGGGGSPFGLLLVAGIVLLRFSRRRCGRRVAF
jgi:hypothetical protein